MRLLRKALENQLDPNYVSPDEQTVVMQGPLSEIYSQALNAMYAKDDPITGEPALESQANDAIMLQTALKSVFSDAVVEPPAPGTTIYGVSQKGLSDETIVDVATSVSHIEDSKQSDFIFVIDATELSQLAKRDTERYVDISEAAQKEKQLVLESLVKRAGGKVAYSLKDALLLARHK